MQRLVVLAVFAITTAASFGPIRAQESALKTAATGRWVVGDQLYVIIPADRKSILAFSTATSRLSRMVLDTPLPDTAKPFVAANVAAIQVGRTVYSIGATGDGWARLDLPVDGLHCNVNQDAIVVSNDDVFYVFASGSNQWVGVDLHTGADLPTQSDR